MWTKEMTWPNDETTMFDDSNTMLEQRNDTCKENTMNMTELTSAHEDLLRKTSYMHSNGNIHPYKRIGWSNIISWVVEFKRKKSIGGLDEASLARVPIVARLRVKITIDVELAQNSGVIWILVKEYDGNDDK